MGDGVWAAGDREGGINAIQSEDSDDPGALRACVRPAQPKHFPMVFLIRGILFF